MKLLIIDSTDIGVDEFSLNNDDFVVRKEIGNSYIVRWGKTLYYCDEIAKVLLEIHYLSKNSNAFLKSVNNVFSINSSSLIEEYFDLHKNKNIIDIRDIECLCSPLIIQWKVSELCNLKCLHCYQNETRTTVRIDTKIGLEGILEMKPFFIVITGGEPTILPDLKEILFEFSKNKIPVKIISNGQFNINNLDWLINDKNVCFMFSIDGDEKNHNSIRGKDTFSKLVTNIRIMLENKCKISTNTVITSLNYMNISSMIIFLANLGIKNVKLSSLIWNEQKFQNKTELDLNFDEFMVLEENLVNLNKQIMQNNFNIKISYSPQRNGKLFTDKQLGKTCIGGIARANIQSNGDVYPCAYISKIFKIANISQKDICNVWFNSETRKEFLYLNRIYTNKCMNCCVYQLELYETCI